mgnify:CR=1 FL=1
MHTSMNYQAHTIINAVSGRTLNGIREAIAKEYKEFLKVSYPDIVWDKTQPYYFHIDAVPYRIGVSIGYS